MKDEDQVDPAKGVRGTPSKILKAVEKVVENFGSPKEKEKLTPPKSDGLATLEDEMHEDILSAPIPAGFPTLHDGTCSTSTPSLTSSLASVNSEHQVSTPPSLSVIALTHILHGVFSRPSKLYLLASTKILPLPPPITFPPALRTLPPLLGLLESSIKFALRLVAGPRYLPTDYPHSRFIQLTIFRE